MGLSGRKVKQRIPKDPRNLSWADDAARFGSNYLSKFGWDSSKGLGAGGDGMTSHIKVAHKLDMLGIGAGQQKDPNGIAWKQNKDFENLLRRLNENLAAEDEAGGKEEDVSEESDEEPFAGEKKKKRKHKESGEEEHTKKKKRKEVEVENAEQTDSITLQSVEIVEEVSIEIKRPVVPRHRAHRARAIAAKNIASKSAAHISEILGIAPDLSAVTTTTSQGKLTSVTDTDALGMDKITTSTKSVADYFKDKLHARKSRLNDSATPSSSCVLDEDDAHEAPRMGLGASRFQMSVQKETRVEEETQRMGLSKFSSLISSSFLASASSFSSFVPPRAEKGEEMGHISDVDSDSPKEKRGKKEPKKRSKIIEEEQEVKEDDDKKRRKKDKKGKNKETSPENDGGGELDERKKKKAQKSKALDPSENSTDTKTAEQEVEAESRKKEKRKKKTDKLDDDKKSRKEKKRHRKSDEES